MIRTLSLATAIAFALALPATAETAPVKAPAATTDVKSAAQGNLFTEEQARVHLSRLGYTNISGLTKNENGAWLGSATKDGKTMAVAVDVKGKVGTN
jgi:putative membrane protein